MKAVLMMVALLFFLAFLTRANAATSADVERMCRVINSQSPTLACSIYSGNGLKSMVIRRKVHHINDADHLRETKLHDAAYAFGYGSFEIHWNNQPETLFALCSIDMICEGTPIAQSVTRTGATIVVKETDK